MRNTTTARRTGAGRKIIDALTEAVEAAERGESSPRGSFIRPDIELPDEPNEYTPAMIRDLRDRHGATQEQFAGMLGISTSQVQSLELGRREPSRLVRRMLDEVTRREVRTLRPAAISQIMTRLEKLRHSHGEPAATRVTAQIMSMLDEAAAANPRSSARAVRRKVGA